VPNIAIDLAALSASVGVNASCGDPQEIHDGQFVPVAVVWSGVGAGGHEETGRGGGGGGLSLPIGAYIRRRGSVGFQPNVIALLVAGAVAASAASRALARVLRALQE